MRKKEVRWISRDKTSGEYDIWTIEPWRTEEGDFNCSESHSIELRDATLNERFELILKRGGLAKITIERQY